MVRVTWIQSRIASYQRLLKWYLIPPCLTLSNIRYVSRLKWRNPGKEVAPSPTPRCSSYWKGSLLGAFDYGCQLYLIGIFDTKYMEIRIKNRYLKLFNRPLAKWIKWASLVREIGVQFQVESYQRHKNGTWCFLA